METKEPPVANFDRPGKLMLRVKQLIREDHRSLMQLYQESGVPYYWLRQFMSAKGYANPSVNRMEYLYEFLSGKKLGV